MGATVTLHVVRVDLAVLARDLVRRYGEACDELAAARWLTRPAWVDSVSETGRAVRVKELSPFVQTDEWGVFLTADDPRTLLNDDEILTVREERGTLWNGRPVLAAAPKARAKAKPREPRYPAAVHDHRSRGPVWCVETGERFDSRAHAARIVGRSTAAVGQAISTGGTCAGRHWTDQEPTPA